MSSSNHLTGLSLLQHPIIDDKHKYNGDPALFSWFDNVMRANAAKLPRGADMPRPDFKAPIIDRDKEQRIEALRVKTCAYQEPIGESDATRQNIQQNQANDLAPTLSTHIYLSYTHKQIVQIVPSQHCQQRLSIMSNRPMSIPDQYNSFNLTTLILTPHVFLTALILHYPLNSQ